MHSSLNSPRVTVSPTITRTKCAPATTAGSNTHVPFVVAPTHSTCAATVPQNQSNRNLPTPVRVKALSELLRGYHNAERVVSGFTHGFMLDFKGPETPLSSHNASSVLINEQVVADKIKKELEMGRITGPFLEPPLPNFKCSPLAIREKRQPGTFRLLHNLSYPYNQDAVNFNIPKESSTVQYAKLQDAIKLIQECGQGCYMAKSDIADAFRLIPLHPSQYHLTGYQFQGKYYYDKCLPMGCSPSCRIFEDFSDAIKWILTNHNVENSVKVLDDFFFIHKQSGACQADLQTFLDLCSRMGIPVAPHKTFGPSQVLEFLGVQLDTIKMEAALPSQKIHDYSKSVIETLAKNKITLRELKSLIGKLQFCTIVVQHGTAFLRRLHDLTVGINKPFHFVRLSKGTKLDLQSWLCFLRSYSGKTIIREIPDTDSRNIHMCSDASGQGYGATYGRSWIQGTWPETWQHLNIAVLELYPVYMMLSLFADSLCNSKIIFYSDNQAVVAVLNAQTSKCSQIMSIIRNLVLVLLLNNISLRARHLPGSQNVVCDTLSRQQVDHNFLRQYGMHYKPTPVPRHLLPENFKL